MIDVVREVVDRDRVIANRRHFTAVPFPGGRDRLAAFRCDPTVLLYPIEWGLRPVDFAARDPAKERGDPVDDAEVRGDRDTCVRSGVRCRKFAHAVTQSG